MKTNNCRKYLPIKTMNYLCVGVERNKVDVNQSKQ